MMVSYQEEYDMDFHIRLSVREVNSVRYALQRYLFHTLKRFSKLKYKGGRLYKFLLEEIDVVEHVLGLFPDECLKDFELPFSDPEVPE